MSNIVQYVLQLKNQMSGPLAQAQALVQRFQASVNSANASTQNMGKGMGLGAIAGFTALAAGAYQFGKSIITAGANMEQTRVQFETFAGSAEAGNAIIAKLQKFSLATPFEDEQVLKAGKSLMAFGTSAGDLEGVLTRIGNISSATGKDFNELTTIYGKAKTAGTLYAEDINQLVEAGIPIIDEFAKQFGKPTSQIKKMASEGKINFGMLETAFENLGGATGKWGTLMDKQSKTVAGKWSSMVGYVQNLMSSLGEGQLPFLNNLIDTGIEVLDWISTNRSKFANIFKPLMDAVQPLVTSMKKVLATLGMTGTAGDFLQATFNRIGNVIKFISPFIETLAGVLGQVWEAAAKVIAIFQKYFNTNKEAQSSLLGLYNAFKTVFGMIASVAGGVLGGIVKAIDGIVNRDFSKIGSGLKDIVAAPLKVIFDSKSYAGMNDKSPGFTDFFAAGGNNTTATEQAREASKSAKAALGTGAGTKASDSKLTTKVGDVSGTKLTSIHLTIQKLTGIENLHTATFKEGKEDLKRVVMELLTGAVSDAVIMAGSN